MVLQHNLDPTGSVVDEQQPSTSAQGETMRLETQPNPQPNQALPQLTLTLTTTLPCLLTKLER